MHTVIPICAVSALLALSGGKGEADAPRPAIGIDNAVALRYFHEAEAASSLDNGKLWGKPLYGPMLFVDPVSRTVVTNQDSPEGLLTREGDVYVGKLPNSVAIANYAVNWAGVGLW